MYSFVFATALQKKKKKKHMFMAPLFNTSQNMTSLIYGLR